MFFQYFNPQKNNLYFVNYEKLCELRGKKKDKKWRQIKRYYPKNKIFWALYPIFIAHQ
jgi:hypothetical protein